MIHRNRYVWFIELKDRLYEWIKASYLWLAGQKVMFVFGDIIADKGLDKRRQYLVEWAISGRHRSNYL